MSVNEIVKVVAQRIYSRIDHRGVGERQRHRAEQIIHVLLGRAQSGDRYTVGVDVSAAQSVDLIERQIYDVIAARSHLAALLIEYVTHEFDIGLHRYDVVFVRRGEI